MEAILERIYRSPRMVQMHGQLSALLAKEKAARRKFYDSIADGEKVEFINGQKTMHSPDKLKHVQIRKRVTKLTDTHAVLQRLGVIGDEKLLVCLTRNDYMPDVVFFGKEKAAQLEPDQMKFPAPDLAVEVLSKSTARRDRGVKFDDYAAHGVREYWIVDPEARTVEIYGPGPLGKYLLEDKVSGTQMVRSRVLTGFQCEAAAFFDDDANAAALRKLMKGSRA